MRAFARLALLLALCAPALVLAEEASAPASGGDRSGEAESSTPGAGAPSAAPARAAAGAPGPFLGDGYRWAEMPILKRVVFDVLAIPANVPSWSAFDFAQLALWTGAGVALSYPASPSVDVRVDRWFGETAGRGPLLWSDGMQGALWATIAVGGLGTWGWATATGRADVAQGLSLMGEALAVTQVYHVTFKLLLGRSGPMDGDRLGGFGGPANAIRVYPAGTPSGHAATFYSLLSAGTAYFEPPVWAQVALHAVVGGVVFFHVVDHRHFASESLWGAAMGWYTGQWVVAHRASYRYADARRVPRFEVVPFVAGGAAGVALGGKF